MDLRPQYFEGCPHRHTLEDRLKALANEVAFDLVPEIIDAPEKDTPGGPAGSPTIEELRTVLTGVAGV